MPAFVDEILGLKMGHPFFELRKMPKDAHRPVEKGYLVGHALLADSEMSTFLWRLR
jgi:hypothetical protein